MVYKLKHDDQNQNSPRYKTRLVAEGFNQKEGVDYDEIFLPVVRHTSIRMLLSLIIEFNMELDQLDVKAAFLYGDLSQRIHMNQPLGFTSKATKNKVCLLKKSLHGLSKHLDNGISNLINLCCLVVLKEAVRPFCIL